MDAERWQRLSPLLDALFELPVTDTTFKGSLPRGLESFWVSLGQLGKEYVGLELRVVLEKLFDFVPIGSQFIGICPIGALWLDHGQR